MADGDLPYQKFNEKYADLVKKAGQNLATGDRNTVSTTEKEIIGLNLAVLASHAALDHNTPVEDRFQIQHDRNQIIPLLDLL